MVTLRRNAPPHPAQTSAVAKKKNVKHLALQNHTRTVREIVDFGFNMGPAGAQPLPDAGFSEQTPHNCTCFAPASPPTFQTGPFAVTGSSDIEKRFFKNARSGLTK